MVEKGKSALDIDFVVHNALGVNNERCDVTISYDEMKVNKHVGEGNFVMK